MSKNGDTPDFFTDEFGTWSLIFRNEAGSAYTVTPFEQVQREAPASLSNTERIALLRKMFSTEQIFTGSPDIVARLEKAAAYGLMDEAVLEDAAAEIERLRTAGDNLAAAIRNHDLREAHLKAWEEARRG